MKIELNRSALDPVTSGAPKNPGVREDKEVQSPADDTATLSTGKASVETLAAQALACPEIRQDKVDAMRQMIKSGEYKIEPEKIADALIQE